MVTTFSRMFQRRGTAAQWAANSTVILGDGELGIESDVSNMKIGDGARQYGALPYVGANQGVVFSTSSEVLAGLVTNKSVAPDTLAANYPRRAVGAVDSIISNNWTFNGNATFTGLTTVTSAPRTGATGVNDVTNRAYIDTLFAGQTSGGSSDVNKAPILNSSGQLDSSYISSEALPRFIGLFNPITGSPTLQNVVGGGITPSANNGDYFIASDSGFYNFDTGTPGAGTTVTQGAQIIWSTDTTSWSVVNPPGTSFDPGAVRRTPSNNSESTIQPGVDAVSNLTLQNRTGQTVDQIRFLDSLGAVLGGVTAAGIVNAIGLTVLRTSSTSDTGADYPDGFSYSFVTSAAGWPIDGLLLSYKESATSVYQFIADAGNFYTRKFTGTWSSWVEYAPLDSPAFINTPTAPTAAIGSNNTTLANTAFVQQELDNIPTAQQKNVSLVAANTRFVTEFTNPIVSVNTLAATSTTGGLFALLFTATETDLNSVYSSGNFTIPTNGGGLYTLQASVQVQNDSGGDIPIALVCNVNGVTIRRLQQRTDLSSGAVNAAILIGSTSLILADGDIVQVVIRNFNSAAITYGSVAESSQVNWAILQRTGDQLLIS